MAPALPTLEERLAALIEEHGVPGASVSVLHDGEVTDAVAGVVNLRTQVDVQADSPFIFQSTTKVWTATLAMQLVDEGLVALDDPVIRRLPGFRTADPRVRLDDHPATPAHPLRRVRGRPLVADE